MTFACARTLELRQLIERDHATFSSMPDLPGQQIRCLFAGLYRETISQWLLAIERIDAPLFTQIAVRWFYEICEASVPGHLWRSDGPARVPWQKYPWLTGTEADLTRERPNNIGPVSVRVFFTAALDYVDFHRSRQHGAAASKRQEGRAAGPVSTNSGLTSSPP